MTPSEILEKLINDAVTNKRRSLLSMLTERQREELTASDINRLNLIERELVIDTIINYLQGQRI